MKNILILVVFAVMAACQSPSPPKSNSEQLQDDQSYIRTDLLAQFKSQIPDFPKEKSSEQKADELELKKLQKSRTQKDCDRAKSEVKVTLETFYGSPYGFLTADQLNTLNPLFDKIRTEGGPYIGQIKNSFNRQRPYDYIKGITPCISKETSLAYPSGHATLAALYADVLTDLFPEITQTIETRRDQIANDRVLAGVHHRSDIKYGLLLGDLLHSEMLKSTTFKSDLEKYKKLLHSENSK